MAAMTTATTASTTPTTAPAIRPALASLSPCLLVVGAMDVANDASSVEAAALLPSPEGDTTLASLSVWVITVLLVSIGGVSLVAWLVDGGPPVVGAMDIDITVLVVTGLFTSRDTSLPATPPDVDNIEVVIATLVDTTGLLEVGSEAGWLVALGEEDAGA